MEALQKTPGVMDAAVFGNALHLVVENAATAEPSIRAVLNQKGITLSSISTIRPTLEDAFVSLTTSRGPEERKQ